MRTTALRFFLAGIGMLLIISSTVIAQEEGDEFDITDEPFKMNPSALEIDTEEESYEPEQFSISEELPSDNAATPEEPEPDVIAADPIKMIDESKEQIQSATPEQPTAAQAEAVVKGELINGNGEEDGLVEVRSNATIYLPYKQRQDRWTWSFSLGAEQVDFPSLLSQFDDNSFNALFGSNGVIMPILELGPKFNFSWGSLGLQLGYSNLSASDSRIGTKSQLDIQRYSATATLYLDALFSEAQLVPYAGVGVWQAEYAERSESFPGDVREYSTEPGYHARFGALIGIDWLDLDSIYRARRETGVTAMFLNVYASTTYMSESAPDPDLENEMDVGASLLFEF